MRTNGIIVFAVVVGLGLAASADAANIGVTALKYIVIDKETAAQKSKTVFVSKDANATLSGDNDVENIGVTVQAAYAGTLGSTTARFDVPTGSSNGTEGWLVAKGTVAKYVNKNAPGGATGLKVAVIKPGKLLKAIGKTRGDSEVLDLIGAGAPAGSVFTAYTVSETSATNSFCSVFPSCSYKEIGGGTGRKLVCKAGTADAGCNAVVPPTTTSTTTSPGSTTSTTLDPNSPVCCEDQISGVDFCSLRDPTACTNDGGTPVANAVCDGGACVAPPGTGACCCQGTPLSFCFATSQAELDCTCDGLLTPSFGAICRPDGCQLPGATTTTTTTTTSTSTSTTSQPLACSAEEACQEIVAGETCGPCCGADAECFAWCASAGLSNCLDAGLNNNCANAIASAGCTELCCP